MDAARYRKLKDLLAEAVELDAGARDAFVDDRCADDPELRRELLDLIASHESASGGALDRALDEMPTQRANDDPERVGPYSIERLLGEGGMGRVYLAHQKEPLERRVALKLVRPGIESLDVLKRFESERQALAMMEHTNIARALDAGTTDDGRPYFVMEYVDGVPITEYCDAKRLDTRQRLELLAQVCDGLQHAHQKAIIHRDIKPTNVLVTEEDRHAVPKVIDFGVAKATTPLAGGTLLTELGQIIGTPEYMSPEQADSGGEDIDTRTDVYALGVLAYELLVGVLPFDPTELRRSGMAEILRKIREDEPPRPSLRPSRIGDVTPEGLAGRRTTAHRLASQLRGDLDWITMKALAKERERRYESAAAMALDIRRFLRHEPVSAGPPSAAYRASKFVRRHRAGVAFASALVVLLVAFAAVTRFQSVVVAHERDRANDQATASRDLADFLVGLFRNADPGRTKGASVTVRELLDAGAREIDKLDDRPLAQASFRETIGSVYGVMGLFDEGQALLEDALEFRAANDDGSPVNELSHASALDEMASLLVKGGKPVEAIALAEKSLEIRRRHLGDHEDVATSLNTLGNAVWNDGDMETAEVHHREALRINRKVFGDVHDAVAGSLHNVGSLRFIDGELDEAERMYREAIGIYESIGDSDSYGNGTTLHTLAMVLERKGEYEEALPLEERSLRIRETVLGPTHPHVALSLTTLSGIHIGLGDPAAGEPLVRRAVEIGTEAWGPDYMDVWWMQRNHADILNTLGRHQEAVDIMAPLVERIEAAPRRVEYALHLTTLGASYLGVGRLDDSETEYRKAVESCLSYEDTLPRETGEAYHGLARCLAAAGRPIDARAEYDHAMQSFDEVEPANDPARRAFLKDFAAFLRAEGDDADRAAEVEAELASLEGR